MSKVENDALALIPQCNVRVLANGFEATSKTPWLKISMDAATLATRWVRITYSSGWCDAVERPVVRICTRDGHFDEILPAALLGRARWTGQIPRGAVEIWVSPTSRTGPFAFRIESVEGISFARIVTRLFRANAWRGMKFLWGLATNWHELARSQVRWTDATHIDKYESWRASNFRNYEASFDGPVRACSEGRHFRFVALVPGLDSLQASLRQQQYMNWSWFDAGSGDPLKGLRDGDFIVPVDEAIALSPLALAILDAEAARNPRADLFYADEEVARENERSAIPVLKPDWSPILQTAAPYIGAFVAARARLARQSTGHAIKTGWIAGILANDSGTIEVAHVRRMLSTRMRQPEQCTALPAIPLPTRQKACVIIPTRDRIDLLSACIASLREHCAGEDFEILVVDNDSVEPASHRYLATLAREDNIRVIQIPGAFNYSAICNRAAKATDGPFLVFLNNDVEILEPGWIARLIAFAARPDVGAVGAKLLYPDGTVQHAGVVLGVRGVAGHFQRRCDPEAPGYFAPAWAPREVGAVTGACMAVEARKFSAVGGFDEIHFPVEASDIDLCLRLAERGWVSVIEPRARLLHRESASRGRNPRSDPRYYEQIARFRERWAAALRDDRYFHPALSLETLDVALG